MVEENINELVKQNNNLLKKLLEVSTVQSQQSQKAQEIVSYFAELENSSEKNIKVFKSANNKSILDITTSLNYHVENRQNEEVYKGKVIFSITEIDSKKYLKAFVNKGTVKVLAQSIMNHTFGKEVYQGGFVDYGGTPNKDSAKIRSRILKIKTTDRAQFEFKIEEGKGKIGEKGGIEMIGKPEMTVVRYVPMEECYVMAHEIYDFIRDQEMLAFLRGKPLNTIMKKNKTDAIKKTEVSVDFSEKEEYVELFDDISDEDYQRFIVSEDYVVQSNPWIGKRIVELTNKELKYITEKTSESTHPHAIELRQASMAEIKRRVVRKRKTIGN